MFVFKGSVCIVAAIVMVCNDRNEYDGSALHVNEEHPINENDSTIPLLTVIRTEHRNVCVVYKTFISRDLMHFVVE